MAVSHFSPTRARVGVLSRSALGRMPGRTRATPESPRSFKAGATACGVGQSADESIDESHRDWSPAFQASRRSRRSDLPKKRRGPVAGSDSDFPRRMPIGSRVSERSRHRESRFGSAHRYGDRLGVQMAAQRHAPRRRVRASLIPPRRCIFDPAATRAVSGVESRRISSRAGPASESQSGSAYRDIFRGRRK